MQNDLLLLERDFTIVCDEAIHEMHNFIQYVCTRGKQKTFNFFLE